MTKLHPFLSLASTNVAIVVAFAIGLTGWAFVVGVLMLSVVVFCLSVIAWSIGTTLRGRAL